MPNRGETLTDRWVSGLKNNRLVAGAIILVIAATALFTLWDKLPRPARDWLASHFPHAESIDDALPKTGWVFAGYTDKSDEYRWSSDQRVTLIRPSGGADRPHIFRNGDIVRPLRPVPQVIVDYRTRSLENQLVPPWQVTEVIKKSEDFTGLTYGSDADLEVMDVSVTQLPDADFAVWLRVTPLANKANE